MDDKEPGRDDTAEEARSEKYKQETEQLVEFHRQGKVLTRDPTLLIGILTAHLLLVATLATVGMLASSNHHETSAEIFLVASVLLLIPIPIGVIWYLRALVKTPPQNIRRDKRNLLNIISQTSGGRALLRIGKNRIYQLFICGLLVFNIASAIIRFPERPRLSLAMAVLGATGLGVFVISLLAQYSFDLVYKDITEIWEFNNLVKNAMGPLGDGVSVISKHLQELSERHDKLVEAHLESNEKNLAAIVALNRFVRTVANIEEPSPEETDKNQEPPT